MALFKDTDRRPEVKEQTPEQVVDAGFYDEMSGSGLENFTADTVSTAYLGMIQPGSTASVDHEPGQWRNSITGTVYGPSVEVIPLGFKTVWAERDRNPPYNTVGRYEPGSIEVVTTRPKPGVKGFPKMSNPKTGNDVQELFVYAVMLKDDQDAGVLLFSPTASSMRTCKAWNASLRSARLPSGKLAPIFAHTWHLTVELVQNPAKQNNPNEKICRFSRVQIGTLVEKGLFLKSVQPLVDTVAGLPMIAAPETSGEVEVVE
jgi:hypothetical protein